MIDAHGHWRRHRAALLLTLVAGCAAACGPVLSPKYEYEEEIYLRLDGSATIYINASVPALVALRGVDLPLDPRARLDRRRVRGLFQSAVSAVEHVSLSRRDGRRFVHLRIGVPDIRRLGHAPPFAWSSYAIGPEDGEDIVYRQVVGAAARHAVPDVGWTGSELVAFRLHVPSRIAFHNSPAGEVQRGNIVVWEQPLSARLESEPIDINVVMAPESILAQTLTLFALTILLAAGAFALVIWAVMRRGRVEGEPADDVPPAARSA